MWLREHRHELLDDAFQAELAAAYQDSPRGHPPVPPAQLALATILQAYTGASDNEMLEATVMDRRCTTASRHRLSRRLRTLVVARCHGKAGGPEPEAYERTGQPA